MTTNATDWKPGDIVPLADRMRYMVWMRGAAVALVLLFVGLGWANMPWSLTDVAVVSAVYALVSLLFTVGWFALRRRGLVIFGLLLIVDALYVAAATYASGGLGSPLRFLILLQLVAVALLASHRTALKLAIWQTLLQLAVFYAEQDGALRPQQGDPYTPGATVTLVVPFLVVVWLVAIGTALCSAVNERELRRRRYDLEALAQLAAGLDVATGEDEVAATLLDQLDTTFELKRSALISLRGANPVVLAARGCATVRPTDQPIRRHPLLLDLATKRETMLRARTSSGDVWLASLLPDATNLSLIPLSADGHCIAVLIAEHGARRGSRLERRVLTMMERFASQTAMALNNADLVAQLRTLASTDALTGLANRRSLEVVLERELARADRDSTPLSLLMLDIDYFKQLNDRHGHQAGDQVLREVATVLSLNCRAMDTAARYGGEEFMVVLPGCSPASALAAAQRVRNDLASVRTVGEAVTASIGVASYPMDAADAESLLAAADHALYGAKHSGRDRVVAAPHVRIVQVLADQRTSA